MGHLTYNKWQLSIRPTWISQNECIANKVIYQAEISVNIFLRSIKSLYYFNSGKAKIKLILRGKKFPLTECSWRRCSCRHERWSPWVWCSPGSPHKPGARTLTAPANTTVSVASLHTHTCRSVMVTNVSCIEILHQDKPFGFENLYCLLIFYLMLIEWTNWSHFYEDIQQCF